MTGDKAQHHDRRRTMRAMTVIGLAVIGIGTLASSALFTDNATVTNNSLTNGTVDIATDPASTAISTSNMAPGDTAYGTVKVSNSGTLALRYAMTSSATNTDSKALASQLQMTIKSGVASCDSGGFSAGSTIYNAGALGGLGSSIAIIGDSATGQQSGDRTLAAGADETLCVRVNLPSSTSNTYQGAATTATFSFAAEQTTNN